MKHLGELLSGFVVLWLLTFTLACGVCAALRLFGVI